MRQFDQEEAERLVNAYSDLILRLSYTYLKSTHDAEDISQTVFLKLLTGGQAFDSPAHEKAWIIRAAANACKDLLRSAGRRRTVALPDKYREAVYLYYYEGYSAREIGALLGRSEAAVNAHLSRGRNRLRTMLGGECCEHGV